MQCIGILSNREFDELLSSAYEFLEFFTRVKVAEPDEEATFAIVQQVSRQFSRDYQVHIEERILERALMLSTNYMLNERHPAKAIKVVRLACEQLDYERSIQKTTHITLRVEDIIHDDFMVHSLHFFLLPGFFSSQVGESHEVGKSYRMRNEINSSRRRRLGHWQTQA